MTDRAGRIAAWPALDGVMQDAVPRIVKRGPAPEIGTAADDDTWRANRSGNMRHAGVVRDEQARMLDQYGQRTK